MRAIGSLSENEELHDEKERDRALPRADLAALDVSLFDPSAVTIFAKSHGIHPDLMRRVTYGIFQNHEEACSAIMRLPSDVQASWKHHFRIDFLAQVSQHASQIDGSVKSVLLTDDGHRIEAVALRSGDSRAAVCVSSQVGCHAGCVFCATARMGLIRNLTSQEILSQIYILARQSKSNGRRVRNVVFMGMGEPLHNEQAVYEAIEHLTHRNGFAMPERRINVSTVGVPDAMQRLADRFPGIQIAFSLHSAIPEKRQKLIPYSRQFSLDEVRSALGDIANRPRVHRRQGPVMIEHILIDGVNDQLEDAEALVDYLQGVPVMINLIPYNPISFASQWKTSPREQRDAFAKRLRNAGFFTTIRYSMGSDVGAACGQLVQSPRFSSNSDPVGQNSH